MHRFNKDDGSGMHRTDKLRFEYCSLPKRLDAATGYKPMVAMPGRKTKEHREPQGKVGGRR